MSIYFVQKTNADQLATNTIRPPESQESNEELLSEQLEEIWRNGLETSWQQRIVYDIFLDKDELIQFGRP